MAEPSFSNGFASPWYGGRIKYPGLWRGCVGSWSPLLGPTGAMLFDQSGRCVHGTTATSTFWSVDSMGHVLNVAGTTARYYDIPTASHLDIGGDLTVTSWVTLTTAGTYGMIAGRWAVPYQWMLGDFAGTLTFNTKGGSHSTGVAASTIADGKPHAVTGVIRGASVELWIDGILKASASFTAPNQTGSSIIRIGNNAGDVGYGPWKGTIAEVELFNSALSPNKITLLTQRPGIMYELEDDDVWGAVEAGGGGTVRVPWHLLANAG